MKTFLKNLSICFVLIFGIFAYSGCSKEEFKHTTVYFKPEYNGNRYQFEVLVTEVSNDYSANVWSRGLDATITIKTITTDNTDTGWLLELYDFDFYLTKPYTVYKTYMYIDSPEQELTKITLQPQTTTTLHLRIDYDSSIFEEENELDSYIIKLWDTRI